jgi:hypothetical protein
MIGTTLTGATFRIVELRHQGTPEIGFFGSGLVASIRLAASIYSFSGGLGSG